MQTLSRLTSQSTDWSTLLLASISNVSCGQLPHWVAIIPLLLVVIFVVSDVVDDHPAYTIAKTNRRHYYCSFLEAIGMEVVLLPNWSVGLEDLIPIEALSLHPICLDTCALSTTQTTSVTYVASGALAAGTKHVVQAWSYPCCIILAVTWFLFTLFPLLLLLALFCTFANLCVKGWLARIFPLVLVLFCIHALGFSPYIALLNQILVFGCC